MTRSQAIGALVFLAGIVTIFIGLWLIWPALAVVLLGAAAASLGLTLVVEVA